MFFSSFILLQVPEYIYLVVPSFVLLHVVPLFSHLSTSNLSKLTSRLSVCLILCITSWINPTLSAQPPSPAPELPPMVHRVCRKDIVLHNRLFKVSSILCIYFFDWIDCLQRHHHVEVIRDGRWSRDIFRRYNYMFLRSYKKRGRTREWEVSICVFPLILLTIIFQSSSSSIVLEA